jgi:membrane protein implicated in regulation of membrane protease activity
MTDLDLERLGDVWRQRPNPEELEELKRAAETVRRRARWAQIVDFVAAVAVAGVVLLLVLSNPKMETLVVGGGAILLLLMSHVRSRRLRQKELRSLTGSIEQMLDQSIERVRATLTRARSGLIIMLPAFLLGLLVAHVALPGSGGELARRIAEQPGLATLIQIVAVVALAIALAQVLRSHRKSRRELERLTALRESYRQDDEAGSAE